MKAFIEKYLIQTNIWVALCFTALLIFFQFTLYHPVYSVWGIVFFGTLAVYNFTRIADWYHFTHPVKKDIPSILLTITGLIGAFVCLLLRDFDIKTFLYLGVLGFMSFAYSLPFKGVGLRFVPFLKLFLIAFVWAGSSIGLLLVVHHDHYNYFLLFWAVFFFVIGITIPFDIRDTHKDEVNLKTIPQVIGIPKAKKLALTTLLLSWVLMFAEIGSFNKTVISWMVTIVFSIFLIWNSSKNKSEFYYSFWMESCSVIPLAVYILLILN